MSTHDIVSLIKPVGNYMRKARCLKAVTEWFKGYNYDKEAVKQQSFEKVRGELLDIVGIGKETADAILLFAFDFLTFVVDAYTKRLSSRLPLELGDTYDRIKETFERDVTPELFVYKNYHALIVINAKTYCRKTPICRDCPLKQVCSSFSDN
jgi:endonuclease-3 related protein